MPKSPPGAAKTLLLPMLAARSAPQVACFRAPSWTKPTSGSIKNPRRSAPLSSLRAHRARWLAYAAAQSRLALRVVRIGAVVAGRAAQRTDRPVGVLGPARQARPSVVAGVATKLRERLARPGGARHARGLPERYERSVIGDGLPRGAATRRVVRVARLL